MKKIIAMLLALVMVLGLAACGASEPAATEAPKAETPAAPAAPAADTFKLGVYASLTGSNSAYGIELRNGIVAAEKIRILKEQGLFTAEIAELSKRFIVKDAVANKSNYVAIRKATLDLVNR